MRDGLSKCCYIDVLTFLNDNLEISFRSFETKFERNFRSFETNFERTFTFFKRKLKEVFDFLKKSFKIRTLHEMWMWQIAGIWVWMGENKS